MMTTEKDNTNEEKWISKIKIKKKPDLQSSAGSWSTRKVRWNLSSAFIVLFLVASWAIERMMIEAMFQRRKSTFSLSEISFAVIPSLYELFVLQ
jgi:hypothetical protein